MGDPNRFELTDLSGPAWVRLPGAGFKMGSRSGRGDAQPVHDVRLSAFQVSRYPVTNAQYAAFVDAGKGAAPGHWPGGDVPTALAHHPVTHVSWGDAEAFCAWLSDRVNGAAGAAHLPTEAQWEFVARGIDGREYPWGNDQPTPEHANFRDSAIEDTSQVGMHPDGATPEGVHDLAGNVRQWCLDWYAPYESASQQDPVGPASGRERILRGGSFVDGPGTLRGSYRFNTDPDGRFGFVGFRIVWSSPKDGGAA